VPKGILLTPSSKVKDTSFVPRLSGIVFIFGQVNILKLSTPELPVYVLNILYTVCGIYPKGVYMLFTKVSWYLSILFHNLEDCFSIM
jgi:hypothetical protein